MTLTGGNAEFRLFDPGFSNSTTPGGANLTLGVIGGAAGAGVIFEGQAPYISTISGDSTYTGTTTVNTGTLQVGTGGTTGTLGVGAVTDNALIVFNRSDTLAVPNTISGTGTVTNAGGAGNVLDLNGAQNYATLNANAGTTHLHGSFTAGTATVNANATLAFGASQTIARSTSPTVWWSRWTAPCLHPRCLPAAVTASAISAIRKAMCRPCRSPDR